MDGNLLHLGSFSLLGEVAYSLILGWGLFALVLAVVVVIVCFVVWARVDPHYNDDIHWETGDDKTL